MVFFDGKSPSPTTSIRLEADVERAWTSLALPFLYFSIPERLFVPNLDFCLTRRLTTLSML